MTKLRFFNGLKEIGGTFVAVETDTTRCMFDFGFANADIIDNKAKVAEGDWAYNYVNLGILTPMDGIYDDNTAHRLGLKSYSEDDKDNFFIISHMHIDHMGGLGMLDDAVPVYMSSDSCKLYKHLAKMKDVEVKEHKKCIGVDYGQSFTVGDITVKVVQIDHDVIGACGYLISTKDGNVCYTGDYRFHGFHRDITEAFAKECHGCDAVITEGVTASFDDIDMLSLEEPETMGNTEAVLQNYMREKASTEQGLIVLNNYNRNVERIHNLLKTISEAGRVLVLEPEQADYVHAFYPDDKLSVVIRSGKDDIDQYRQSQLDFEYTAVTLDDIAKAPAKYVLQQDYRHVYDLIPLKNDISIYVHADGSPLGDYDPSYKKFHMVLDTLGITHEYMGTGGHSRPYYIRYMLDAIEPKVLIPLHSFRPEQVQSAKAGKRILPEYGQSYELSGSDLKLI
jgi:mRNA degradation ribonuclease J1/J2